MYRLTNLVENAILVKVAGEIKILSYKGDFLDINDNEYDISLAADPRLEIIQH